MAEKATKNQINASGLDDEVFSALTHLPQTDDMIADKLGADTDMVKDALDRLFKNKKIYKFRPNGGKTIWMLFPE